MKLGVIAGNRFLPLILAQKIKEKDKNCQIIAICFKGETNPSLTAYTDKSYWIKVGQLGKLREILAAEDLKQCIMIGQINPLRIFKRKHWDEELSRLVNHTGDFRPHTIFNRIIDYLEKGGITFLDSITYLKEELAQPGIMNNLDLSENLREDISFGTQIISKFTDLDIGQTVAVKTKTVLALESLEGTDRTIKRAYSLAGYGCTILKFSKANQDLRFDVPVVGFSTLRLLKTIRAASLVLEAAKVIILEKAKFLSLAAKWNIPVVGQKRV